MDRSDLRAPVQETPERHIITDNMTARGSGSPADPDTSPSAPSRREFLALAAGLALGLVGCGDEQESGAGASETAYPRDVRHATGTVHLKRQPQHIHVARNFSELDAVLALGIIPTSFGTFPDRPLTGYQLAAGGDRMRRMDATDGVQLEQLLAEDIDLVVASELFVNDSRDKINEQVRGYQRIAPLIALPEDVAGAFAIVTRALALNGDRAAARLEAFNDRIAAFPRPARTPRIALVQPDGPGTIGIYTADTPGSTLMRRIGLGRPVTPAGIDLADYYAAISEEQLGSAIGDADIVLALDFDDSPGLDELEQRRLFRALPPVRAGRYVRIDNDESIAVVRPSALSIETTLRAWQRVVDVL
jgi:ABC-type Fe3+-hydroxamate transport system substrate-binding protein